jgi:hypothetical protein
LLLGRFLQKRLGFAFFFFTEVGCSLKLGRVMVEWQGVFLDLPNQTTESCCRY